MSIETPTAVVRWISYRGERLKVEQIGSTCLIIDADGYPYARLSCELEDGAKAPAGRFWLRWWSENQHLAEWLADAGILRTEGQPIQISNWVATMAAWIAPEEA